SRIVQSLIGGSNRDVGWGQQPSASPAPPRAAVPTSSRFLGALTDGEDHGLKPLPDSFRGDGPGQVWKWLEGPIAWDVHGRVSEIDRRSPIVSQPSLRCQYVADFFREAYYLRVFLSE